MFFRLEDLLADKVVVDELAMKETAQTLCDLQKTMKKKTACSSSAACSKTPQQQKTGGSKSLIDPDIEGVWDFVDLTRSD